MMVDNKTAEILKQKAMLEEMKEKKAKKEPKKEVKGTVINLDEALKKINKKQNRAALRRDIRNIAKLNRVSIKELWNTFREKTTKKSKKSSK